MTVQQPMLPTMQNNNARVIVKNEYLHPAVLELGRMYAHGVIRGGSARCRAMLQCFSKVVDHYKPPVDIQDIREHFNKHVLQASFSYWTEHCRRHSVGMGSAFSFLKSAVASMERGATTLEQLQAFMHETIGSYIRGRIDCAGTAIVQYASSKIVHGDVVLIYGFSEVISKVLLKQKELKKDFRVIVADSRPLSEGRIMLKTLRKAGISCTYILLQAVSYIMKDVTKVFLGAAAVMGDGSVQGRVGTACVAMMAQRKPVLVCCETFKMTNQVQLDSIADNEVDNPSTVMSDAMKPRDLQVFNPLYDLTPPKYINGFVTEVGICRRPPCR